MSHVAYFAERGFVPISCEQFELLTSPPRKVGDEALIRVLGNAWMRPPPRKVILLRSAEHGFNGTYLVG